MPSRAQCLANAGAENRLRGVIVRFSDRRSAECVRPGVFRVGCLERSSEPMSGWRIEEGKCRIEIELILSTKPGRLV